MDNQYKQELCLCQTLKQEELASINAGNAFARGLPPVPITIKPGGDGPGGLPKGFSYPLGIFPVPPDIPNGDPNAPGITPPNEKK
jgi:hypothetical protein